MKRGLLLLTVFIALSGCSWLFGKSSKETGNATSEGKRVSVLELAKKPEADPSLGDFKFTIPPVETNKDWPQAGGNPSHSHGNLSLSPVPEVVWKADIGEGSSKYFKLLAPPAVSGGKVFTLDARGVISAFSAGKGERLWTFDTTPPDARGEAISGGIGVNEDVIYATSGFGEVLALKTGDGSLLWRKPASKPLRGAPTISGGKVFVVTIDNELMAFSAASGERIWRHGGITESASLMGASSPAAAGDSVIVAYSSGEIFNLRVQNGRVAWSDVLAVPEKIGALPAIADIRGLPVIDRDLVFAVSHSGRTAAIDHRTGNRAWDVNIGGVNTPEVVGDAVYIVDNDARIVALTRTGGRIAWVKELQRLKDPADRESAPVFWWGPLLAGGRLWLTNSLGELAAFSPEDGTELEKLEIGEPFFIPPIAADGVMYLISDNGRLIALR